MEAWLYALFLALTSRVLFNSSSPLPVINHNEGASHADSTGVFSCNIWGTRGKFWCHFASKFADKSEWIQLQYTSNVHRICISGSSLQCLYCDFQHLHHWLCPDDASLCPDNDASLCPDDASLCPVCNKPTCQAEVFIHKPHHVNINSWTELPNNLVIFRLKLSPRYHQVTASFSTESQLQLLVLFAWDYHAIYHHVLVSISTIKRCRHRRFGKCPISYYPNSASSFQVQLSGDVHPNPGPDGSTSPKSSVNNSTCTELQRSNINCVLYNARSLVNKLVLFQSELLVNNIDIAFVTESWLDSTVLDGEFNLNPKYSIFRKDRNRHGGGIFVAISKHLKPSRCCKFEHPDLEFLWVELSCNRGIILLGCIYRPPNANSKFFDYYETVLESVLPFAHNYLVIAVLGDFNIDVNTTVPNVQRLYNISNVLNFNQLVYNSSSF